MNELNEFEIQLSHFGYKKDNLYYKEGINSKVRLQEIDSIELFVYFDNSDYYDYDFDT